MTDRKATSIRLSAEADRLLDQLNERLGAKNRSAILELAIRELARKWLPAETHPEQPVRLLKYADHPQYWSLSDSDYAEVLRAREERRQ